MESITPSILSEIFILLAGSSGAAVVFYLLALSWGEARWIEPYFFVIFLTAWGLGAESRKLLDKQTKRLGISLGVLVMLLITLLSIAFFQATDTHPNFSLLGVLFLIASLTSALCGASPPPLILGIGSLGFLLGRLILLPILGVQVIPYVLALPLLISIRSLFKGSVPPTPVSPTPLPIESGSGFVLGAVVFLSYQRAHFFSFDSEDAVAALGITLFLSSFICFFMLQAPPRTYSRIVFGVILSAFGCAVLPSFLSLDFYPDQGIFPSFLSLVLIFFLLVGPAHICLTSPPFRSGGQSLSAAGGILFCAIGIHFWGISRTHFIILVVACLAFVLAMLFQRKIGKALSMGIVVLVFGIVFGTEEARFPLPQNEHELASRFDKGDHWVLSRDSATQEIRIRKNRHHVIQSLSLFQKTRRHTLLPFRLHQDESRVLLLGGTNPIGIHAALETPLEELWIAEPNQSLIEDFLPRFAKPNAQKSQKTPVHVVAQGGLAALNSIDRFFDVIVIENKPPWAHGSHEISSEETIGKIKDHLYPDGVAVQWFAAYQWSLENLSRVLVGWQKVFGKQNISVWRSDLLPDYPVIAFVAGLSDPYQIPKQSSTDGSFLSNRPGAFLLASANQLGKIFDLSVKSFSLQRPQLEILATLNRLSPKSLVPHSFFSRFLSVASSAHPYQYGALIWSRGVAHLQNRQKSEWFSDREMAKKYLQFDPSSLYPDLSSF